MIKINLLPVEKRKAERTPVLRFSLIVANVLVASVLVVYLVWVNLITIPAKQEEIQQENVRLEQLKPFVAEHDRLVAEHARLNAKVTELRNLLGRDVTWWRVVDALWDVIHEHPKVWIDDFRILDERSVQSEVKRVDPDSKDVPPYGVTMRCHVAGSEVAEMTRFRNALKANPVLQRDLWNINFNVEWKVDDEKDYQERSSISFTLSMWGLPPDRRDKLIQKAQAAGARGAPSAQPVSAPPGGNR